jgi:hypothetical protein
LSKANDAKGMAEKRKEINKTKREMKSLGETTEAVAKTIKNLDKASPKEIQKSIRTLRKQMDGLNADTDEYQSKLQQLQKLNVRFDELKKQQRGVGIETSKSSGLMQSFGSMAKTAYLAVVAAIGAAIVKAVQYREEIAKAQQQVAAFSGLQGADLTRLTRDIAKLEKFGADQQSVLKAANTLVNTYGKNWDEAIEIITDGFNKGADLSGEWLSSISEYSTQFKAAGASIEELTEVSIIAGRSGVFSDKAPDTIKEGMLRIREMNKSTRDALKLIGIDASKMQKQIQKGQITVFDALKQVSTELAKLPDDAQAVGKVLADVFGGAGEDAGLDFLRTIKDIDGEFANINTNITDSEKATRELSDAWTDFRFAVLGQDSWFTKAIDATKEALADLLNLFVDTQSEAIKIEQQNLNLLVASLKTAEKGSEGWKRIRDEINSQYPDFLKNLKDEEITNEALNKALLKVNKVYDSKFQVTAKEERLNEILSKRQDLQEEEADIIVDINKDYEKYVKNKVEDADLELKILQLKGQSSLAGIFLARVNANAAEGEERLNIIKKERSKLDEEYNKLITELTKLKKADAKADTDATKTIENNTKTRIALTEEELEKRKKAEEAAKKAREAAMKELQKLRDAILSNDIEALTGYEKEFNAHLERIKARREKNETEWEKYLRENQEKATEKDNEQRKKAEKAAQDSFARQAEIQTEYYAELESIGLDFATNLGGVLGSFLGDQEKSLKDFGKATVLVALEATKRLVQLSIAQATAQSLASPESVATFGTAGFAKAAILTALIEAAFAAVSGVVQQGFSEGGSTGSGAKNEPAGIVHKGEYVVPQEGVQNPAVSSVLGVLESARVSGSLQTLDYDAISRAIPKKGFQEGGFTNGFQPNVTIENTALLEQMSAQNKLLINTVAAINQWQTNLKVINNARETIEANDELTEVRNRASA